jgi:phospholipid/cholesterol/gamma-HCH transport system substrate-binding protein
MEQQSARLEYKVGIFIAIGLIMLMVTILLLGADKAFFTNYMRLTTRFDDVQGLFPGSVVSLAGLPVGNVEKIHFVPEANRLELTLKIDRVFADRLYAGTTAEIRTQGALGDKFVYLIPGTPSATTIPDGTLIGSNDTDFMKMLTSREDGVAGIIDVIKELRTLLAAVNQNGQTGVLMKNMAETSQKLNTAMGTLNGVLLDVKGNIPQDQKLKSAIVSLSSILTKIDQGKGTLGQLINDPSLHQSLKAFLGSSPQNRYMKDMIRESLQHSETK